MNPIRSGAWLFAVLMLASASVRAQAEPGSIELRAIAEREVQTVDAAGEMVLRREPASQMLPGDMVVYTIEATNVSNAAVADVAITDPIPEHTAYEAGSASGAGALVTYSIDGGQSYDAPDRLVVTEPDGTRRPAETSNYTHIRWQLPEPLEPGESRAVGFRARLR